MMSDEKTLQYITEENRSLYRERNAAEQRAEQAERERDEARELLSRIRAITTAAPQPAPTVKADTPKASDIEPLLRLLDQAETIDANIVYEDSRTSMVHALMRQVIRSTLRMFAEEQKNGGAS